MNTQPTTAISKYSETAGFIHVLSEPLASKGKVYPFLYRALVPDKLEQIGRLLEEPGKLTTEALRVAILGATEKRLPAELRRLEGFPVAWLKVYMPKGGGDAAPTTTRCEIGQEIPPPAASAPTPASGPVSASTPKPYSKTPLIGPMAEQLKTSHTTTAQQAKKSRGLDLF